MCGEVDARRVCLRDFSRDDIEDVMKWTTDEAVAEFTAWERHDTRESVEKFMEKEVFPHKFYKAICLDGRAVGAISLNRGEALASCRAEVGYAVGRQWSRKGIATHALRLAVVSAFQHMPAVHRIEALVEKRNVASQKVLEKCGFVNEGFLVDYLIIKGSLRSLFVYRFLRSDLPKLLS